MTSEEFSRWVEEYDNSGILEEKEFPGPTVAKINAAGVVVTSDLKRSIESAAMISPHLQTIQHELFRETELPLMTGKGLKLVRLSPNLWAVLLRCLWLSGFSKECESISHARKRAEEAAQMLIDHAEANTSVALVGHGFFNLLIGKELHKRGWLRNGKNNSKHWSCTTYVK